MKRDHIEDCECLSQDSEGITPMTSVFILWLFQMMRSPGTCRLFKMWKLWHVWDERHIVYWLEHNLMNFFLISFYYQGVIKVLAKTECKWSCIRSGTTYGMGLGAWLWFRRQTHETETSRGKQHLHRPSRSGRSRGREGHSDCLVITRSSHEGITCVSQWTGPKATLSRVWVIEFILGLSWHGVVQGEQESVWCYRAD